MWLSLERVSLFPQKREAGMNLQGNKIYHTNSEIDSLLNCPLPLYSEETDNSLTHSSLCQILTASAIHQYPVDELEVHASTQC